VRSRVRFAPAAENDLLNIWQYRANYSVESADALVERLINATNRLEDYPRSAPIRLHEPMELRGISAHGHILFYIIGDNGVTVMRVSDARQNWRDGLVI
jgi:plasmid stabilization system protein ParE